jgi:hypothetical protein
MGKGYPKENSADKSWLVEPGESNRRLGECHCSSEYAAVPKIKTAFARLDFPPNRTLDECLSSAWGQEETNGTCNKDALFDDAVMW